MNPHIWKNWSPCCYTCRCWTLIHWLFFTCRQSDNWLIKDSVQCMLLKNAILLSTHIRSEEQQFPLHHQIPMASMPSFWGDMPKIRAHWVIIHQSTVSINYTVLTLLTFIKGFVLMEEEKSTSATNKKVCEYKTVRYTH